MAIQLHRSNSVPADLNQLDLARSQGETAIQNAYKTVRVAHVTKLAMEKMEVEAKLEKAESKLEKIAKKHQEIGRQRQLSKQQAAAPTSNPKQSSLMGSLFKGSLKLATAGILAYGAHTLANTYAPEQYKELQSKALDGLTALGIDEETRDIYLNTAQDFLDSALDKVDSLFQQGKMFFNIGKTVAQDLYYCHKFEITRIEDCSV